MNIAFTIWLTNIAVFCIHLLSKIDENWSDGDSRFLLINIISGVISFVICVVLHFKKIHNWTWSGIFTTAFYLVIFGFVVWGFVADSTVETPHTEAKTSSFVDDSCGDKYYCKEMSSCREAIHYLRNCGLSRLDGDNDGIPCETICY